MPAKHRIVQFIHSKQGNISLLAALSTPIVVAALALGLDYGNLTLERRTLQQHSDLAAITAAAEVSDADNAVLNHFALNGLNMGVLSNNGLLTKKGLVKYDKSAVFQTVDGYAVITKGRYTPDPSVAVSNRFVENATPYDAAKVVLVRKTELYFAGMFMAAPEIKTQSTASLHKLASFSVGSRLASLDDGILNAVLGKMLGSTLSLSIMNYNQLLNADVDALKLADAIGIELKLTGATYSQVLDTDLAYGTFLTALAKTSGLAPATATVINNLQKSVSKTQLTFKLGEVVNLAPYLNRKVGTGDTLKVQASVFDLIAAAAGAASGSSQVAVDLGTSVPGLADARINIAIGAPPAATPSIRAGDPGSIVHTAQTRLTLVATLNSLSGLGGAQIQLPIYVEVANAEAKLSGISCYGGARHNASVNIDVVPGVAELAIGTVDTTAFSNFGTKPRVTKAKLVDALLLKISGESHVEAKNMKAKTISFQPGEIIDGTVKTVSTENTLATLMTSLVGDLKLDINVLSITLGTPTSVQKALVTTVATATPPLDTVLYNTLLALGIRVGEADTRVTGVSCQSPVLVQ